ncbi:MAG: sulfotransferase family protein [Actinomycetota bacterium]|nr:sulfotransferase family protein [Actinomycetota bacterium]
MDTAPPRHPVLALWALPRTASTAFERMMIERGDHTVVDEPFSLHYYFGAEKVSGRFAEVAPASRPPDIVARLEDAAIRRPVFLKDMAYHVAAMATPRFMDRFVSTFLIRDPASALPSLARKWPDFTSEETGYEAVARLVELEEGRGRPVVVIDSDDLCRRPEDVVRAWCVRMGIDFVPRSMEWAAGMRPEWELWPDWYEATARTTGFRPPVDRPAPTSHDPRLAAEHRRCLPIYRELRERRLCPTG